MIVSTPRAACMAPPASDRSAATTSACGSLPNAACELTGSAPHGAERDAAAIQFHSYIPANRSGCAKNRYLFHDCYNILTMAETLNTRVTSLEESMRRVFIAH